MEALNIAKFILNFQKEIDLKISNLKLQVFLYYMQAYHIAFGEGKLFEDDIVAWEYGPVVKAVYHKYKSYGYDIIPCENLQHTHIKAKSIGIITNVLNTYSDYNTIDLVNRIQSNSPWFNAYEVKKGSVINTEEMGLFYKQFISKDIE